MNWQQRKYSLQWITKQAYDHQEMDNLLRFLKSIGVVPEDVKPIQTGRFSLLNPAGISGQQLYDFACDWDAIGPSSPVEMVEAMAYELKENNAA